MNLEALISLVATSENSELLPRTITRTNKEQWENTRFNEI